MAKENPIKVHTPIVWSNRISGKYWLLPFTFLLVLLLPWTPTVMPPTNPMSPPFSLLVTLQFQDDQSLQTFLQYITPVAKYVRDHEPDTLAYEVLLSDKDPLQVLVLERYRDKEEAYLKVHKSSKPFLEFRPKLGKLQEEGKVVISGHSYIDSMVGFGDRA